MFKRLKNKLSIKSLSPKYLICFLLGLAVVIWFGVTELRTSALQSHFLAKLAPHLTVSVENGESQNIRFPSEGPYDIRLGYSRLPQFIDTLKAANYSIVKQARISSKHSNLIDHGVYPIYREKTRAGLEILDDREQPMYRALYPERTYPDFDSIPPLIVKSLLYIENRELLSPATATQNPAIEWDRFAMAIFDLGLSKIIHGRKPHGASTLPTQMEKFRHSPSGLTSGAMEKLRQMLTASIRAYLDGTDTTQARTRIILDYINSIPLSAVPGYGEVNGLGDGLWAWFGSDFHEVNRILREDPGRDPVKLKAKAQAYKQVLALFVAQRRPSYYLAQDPKALSALTDSHLRLMANNGIIDADLLAAGEQMQLTVLHRTNEQHAFSFVERKAANAARTGLLNLLRLPALYELDRLDLKARSTLNTEVQQNINETLQKLKDFQFLQKSGLLGDRLLSSRNDPGKIVYSVTLFEHVDDVNRLRIQTDTLDQPFNVNEGVKLDLGSTAKLRTLLTYLEVIEDLHGRYAEFSRAQLKKFPAHPRDKLSAWALAYLAEAKDRGLPLMLKAAMQRHYSASPYEVFFTGGGQHTFQNFTRDDDARVMTVEEALRRSVNLVFIRLMRDIVRYHIYGAEDSPGRMLEDRSDERRRLYLERFADKEGKIFMRSFFKKYENKTPEEIVEILFKPVSPALRRQAAVFRALDPQASFEEFEAFLKERLPNSKLSKQTLEALYRGLDRAVLNLADRGFIARIHPLEIWMADYMRKHPQAKLKEVLDASFAARREVYTWLYQTRHKNAQNTRIQIVLEAEAFTEIHRTWKRLGYPFDYLVPSYATSIGSSADRPSALAELMGIIVNGGVRYPESSLNMLHFAEDTPYQTLMEYLPPPAEQVIGPEIAQVVKDSLREVVERGTAVRVKGVFKGPDGKPLAVGGKTGTGDHRHDTYGARGRLLSSRVVNRTATFAFYIGDRFFGTIVAYVSGPDAASFRFTSALPAQLLKILAPQFEPLVNQTEPKQGDKKL
ncbi:MAG: glycosyl transferase family 51 [Deltaproteobacteria bacterium]|nr:glycosyl transferase family 51 [Deltaproteobacteria bacterium]